MTDDALRRHGRFRELADALAREASDTEDGGSPYREASNDLLERAAQHLELGRCQWQLARFDAADRSLTRALELRERLLPAGDPLVTDAKERLAALRHYQLRDADELFEDVVAARVRAHGTDHVATAIAMRNHGAYLRDNGHRGAVARLDEAAALLERLVGVEHPEYAAALKARACLELRGPPPGWQALALAERAYQASMLAHPDDHPFVGAAVLLLARGQAKTGDARSARRSYAEAGRTLAAAYGDAHPLLALIASGVAGLDRDDDEPAAAITGWRCALEIHAHTYTSTPFTARTFWKIAEARLQLGEPDHALAEIEAGLAVLPSPGAEWSWRTGWLVGLAEVAAQLGHTDVAHRVCVLAADLDDGTHAAEIVAVERAIAGS